jgi:hypothetical protein
MNNLENIKNRIRALSEMTVTNGCSEAESLTAINMVGKLLAKYNLSMTECELREELCETSSIHTGSKHSTGIAFAVVGIGEFTDCKVWTSRSSTQVSYNFFGQKSDVEMALYLYRVMVMAMTTELMAFKMSSIYNGSKSKRGASSNFLKGMGIRISNRLKEMKNQTTFNEIDSRGNALMVLKSQLVNQQFSTLDLKLRSNKSILVGNDAFFAGSSAGNRVNISRPIDNRG